MTKRERIVGIFVAILLMLSTWRLFDIVLMRP